MVWRIQLLFPVVYTKSCSFLTVFISLNLAKRSFEAAMKVHWVLLLVILFWSPVDGEYIFISTLIIALHHFQLQCFISVRVLFSYSLHKNNYTLIWNTNFTVEAQSGLYGKFMHN